MTALNKEIRKHIIESVIKGTYIPAQKEAIIASTREAVYEALRAQLPPDFEAATKHMPKDWFGIASAPWIHHEVHPEEILKRGALTADEVKTRDSSPSLRSARELRVPFDYRHRNIASMKDKAKPDQSNWETILAAQIDAATKLADYERNLRAELRAFLASVKNVKQLLEKKPDFERHLPASTPKPMPLVVSTVKLDTLLDRLGFDLGAPATAQQ
jgi:hypothetical protein